MPKPGYIYVLINHSMSNLLKVGKTSRDTEGRAKELSSVTGVPSPFLVAFDAYFNDCDEAENYIHHKLEQRGYRLSENREFFQAPLKEVIALIVETEQLFKSQSDQSENSSEATHQNKAIQNELPETAWSDIEALATYYLNTGNNEEAYRLYKEAVAAGSPSAYSSLGKMTLKGLGCLEDEQEALTLLEAGVHAGDESCCAELALYHFGKGNFMTGNEWFEKYLESGKSLNPANVFHCCFYFLLDENFPAYGSHSKSLKNLIEKYRVVLSPIKDAIIGHATKVINSPKAIKDPDFKALYAQVAHEIKRGT